jgi:uncharacterized protein YbjT (DUF2867 family)
MADAGGKLVVVFGAGGGTGAEAVRRAAALGHAVRAVVREPDKHRERLATEGRVELVAGDVTDAVSVSAALAGAAGCIFAAATSSYFGADDVDHKARSRQGRAPQAPALRLQRSRSRAKPRRRACATWRWRRTRRACGAWCS